MSILLTDLPTAPGVPLNKWNEEPADGGAPADAGKLLG